MKLLGLALSALLVLTAGTRAHAGTTFDAVKKRGLVPVSYTHLTLPTKA